MSRKSLVGRLIREAYLSNKVSYLLLCLIIGNVIISVYLPVLIGKAVDGLTSPSFFESFLPLIWKMLGMILVNTGLLLLIPLLSQKIAYTYSKELRDLALAKLHSLPLLSLQQFSTGDLVSRLTADLDQLTSGLMVLLQSFLAGIFLLFAMLVAMFRLDMVLFGLVVCLSPLALVFANTIAKRSFSFHQKQSEARGQQTAFVEEAISHSQVIQSFGAEADYQDKMLSYNQAYANNALKATFYSSLVNPSTRFVNALIYLVLIGVGAVRMTSGWLTLGELVTFLNYTNQYTKPFNDISSVFAELQNSLACADRLYSLLDMKEPVTKPQIVDSKGEGEVRFENISFAYDKGKPLIDKLSLTVPAGSRVAIVGPTGSGKSTLMHLLLGEFALDKGEIFIDGQSVSSLNQESLYAIFGIVSQEPWLKEASVAENIAYGNIEASLEDIKKAAQTVGADLFIQQLEHGYDTLLSDGASHLSQGQKQLLTLARLLLTNPKIIILDEATSSVDTRTEVQIQESLESLMKGRTSFIIAHRLSTIQSADIILVLVDGKILESGSHDELMAAQGYYYQMQMV